MAAPPPPEAAARRLPMFPLQRLPLPGSALPLHVFEPRYVELTRDCLDGDRLFGVVLIMRGSEVGADPDQVRSDVGVLVRIRRARPTEGERWILETDCLERLRVRRWLADVPYPRALIEPWPDPPTAPGAAGGPAERVTETYRRIAAMLAAERAGAPPELRFDGLSSDPTRAAYQLCGAAPVGELDRLRLLEAAGTAERLGLLAELLEGVEETLRLLRGSGEDAPPG